MFLERPYLGMGDYGTRTLQVNKTGLLENFQKLVQGVGYLRVCGILEAGVADPDDLVKVVLQALARLLLGYFRSETCTMCDKI
jgi:hypothetical protein